MISARQEVGRFDSDDDQTSFDLYLSKSGCQNQNKPLRPVGNMHREVCFDLSLKREAIDSDRFARFFRSIKAIL
jgi:hypothetical protein